jgi:hypothetical protein
MTAEYCPNCGGENTLEIDENRQRYCTSCDYDIADDDDVSNPPDRDAIPYEDDEPYDSILAQQELSDLDEAWNDHYDDDNF